MNTSIDSLRATFRAAARRTRVAWAAPLGLCLLMVACGGGGGGGSATPAAPGVLKVTVRDSFGSAIASATVQGEQATARTDAQGVALLLVDPSASAAGVAVSRDTFVGTSVTTPLAPGEVNEIGVTLNRVTAPAGGSMASRSGLLPSVDPSGRLLSFEIELLVVDGASGPVDGLGAAQFALRSCTPDPANERSDCIRGTAAAADLAYTPLAATPQSVDVVPAGVARPYAAAMLLDQSGSIQQTDPTGARLFATKSFLGGLGNDDRVLLAAFAGGSAALIPTPPLAVYGSFRARAEAVPSYFATLDTLNTLVGGDTPLYQSLDTLRQQVAADTSLPSGLSRAIVVFSDGADTYCANADLCRAEREGTIQRANADQVRLFAIGLSSGAHIDALGELANRTGGALLYADTAEQLLPLYGSVGKLLSLSLPAYRLRWTVRAADAFKPGSTLLGRVQVTAGGSTFDVPFVVAIP